MATSNELEPGYRVKTILGGDATVEKLLGSGGQGSVYQVSYQIGGTPSEKALKWYSLSGQGNDPDAFYDNLQNNVTSGSPDPIFLWPQDLTVKQDGSFGYIMDLRPEGYYDLTDFLLTKVRMSSYKATVEAMIEIVSAFRILHNMGYSYQDLNDGNFLINPQNGKVLIPDNDNVAPDGTNMGIIGKPKYIAPEIVKSDGKKQVNQYSDRYSMALILFLILTNTHPLQGKRFLVDELTPNKEKRLYGTEALFILDPDDDSNRPAMNTSQKNVMKVWPELPGYIQELFLKAFSQEDLQNPSHRSKEKDWLKALVRFRSDIVHCHCGNDIFVKNDEMECVCESCGKHIILPYRLKFADYSVPGVPKTRVYRCQVETACNADEALDRIASVVDEPKHPGTFGLKNLGKTEWHITESDGEQIHVVPGQTYKIRGEETIHIYSDLYIEANKQKK